MKVTLQSLLMDFYEARIENDTTTDRIRYGVEIVCPHCSDSMAIMETEILPLGMLLKLRCGCDHCMNVSIGQFSSDKETETFITFTIVKEGQDRDTV